jgi:hypothetical protein
MALCACGTTVATGRDIVSRLSAPSLNRSGPGAKPTSAREATCSARAPTSSEAAQRRTRTPVEPNEDARRTTKSATDRIPSCQAKMFPALRGAYLP